MIHVSSPTAQKFDRVKRKGVAFLSGLFRTKRLIVGMKIDEEDEMERPRIETPAIVSNRIPSSLSVAAVDVVLSPSTILASRESLIESMEESESDDAILMSQELGDADPLTLAQVHEHLVRSPPPASWPMTPAFPFSPVPVDNSCPLAITRYKTPSPSKNTCCKRDRITDSSTLSKSEPSNDLRVTDRHTHTFSLLNPTPIRTLSEVRRLHRSADDNVQLMSSE
ncbi:hypothetical protein G9C98_006147 [Cotesia typhae]|uniref:Uncharacterized protein n=1 Tax=Cotesia typhae TaxID=2053667 RepID=A0A8J5RCB8_9HYME|nr:hypothetical protein G9C98_006147 [Cotesia typhae]